MAVGYRQNDYYTYENEYYKQVDAFRFGKLLAHYEIYKKVLVSRVILLNVVYFVANRFFKWQAFEMC